MKNPESNPTKELYILPILPGIYKKKLLETSTLYAQVIEHTKNNNIQEAEETLME